MCDSSLSPSLSLIYYHMYMNLYHMYMYILVLVQWEAEKNGISHEFMYIHVFIYQPSSFRHCTLTFARSLPHRISQWRTHQTSFVVFETLWTAAMLCGCQPSTPQPSSPLRTPPPLLRPGANSSCTRLVLSTSDLVLCAASAHGYRQWLPPNSLVYHHSHQHSLYTRA